VSPEDVSTERPDFVSGLMGSVAANVMAVVPDLVDLQVVAAALAGFPPVASTMSTHLLVRTTAAR
jgi:hypothetical protein